MQIASRIPLDFSESKNFLNVFDKFLWTVPIIVLGREPRRLHQHYTDTADHTRPFMGRPIGDLFQRLASRNTIPLVLLSHQLPVIRAFQPTDNEVPPCHLLEMVYEMTWIATPPATLIPSTACAATFSEAFTPKRDFTRIFRIFSCLKCAAGLGISECPHSTAFELYQKINLLRSLGVTLSRRETPLSISAHLDDYLMQAGMVKP